MKQKWMVIVLLALPLAVAGLVYGPAFFDANQPAKRAGYVCPLTGAELSCSTCCPLNARK